MNFRYFLFILILVFSTNYTVFSQTENYTYKLTQSGTNIFWTTVPSNRIFKNMAVPSKTGSGVKVYSAKNETEPFILVIKPAQTGNITVSMGSFGTGITTEIYRVKYVNITTVSDNLGKTGPYPDPLSPVENNASISVTANENTAFWINVYVPSTVTKGDYTANFTIGGVNIPVTLHVFNFAVPAELHINSQMNFSYQTILTKYSVTGTGTEYWNYVNNMNLFFIRHRLTPRNPLWPGGLTSGGGACFISYDCNGTLSDPYGIWGFEQPADKFLKGNGFNNGTGYPIFQAITFKNNDASADQRPTTFCNQTLSASDWCNNPTSAYNQKWFAYMTSIQNYLNSKGLLNKSYYYFANEPQDQADYNAVAWYAQEMKKAAPNLKLMVSEEPKPEIYNHPTYTGAKIDIWLPVLTNYNPTVSWAREKNNGEHTWIYFLHSTRPPYFNPVTLDHPGIESKFTGWFLWKYRIKGIAYYAIDDWSKNPWTDPLNTNHNGDLFMLYPPSETNQNITYGSNNHRFVPSIRFELMRDGFEDFEYLYLLNGGAMPVVNVQNSSDTQVDKIILGLTSYTRDDEFMYNLRRLIGLKIGGEISTIPDIKPESIHPRAQGAPGNYYINFQDPNGNPTANPLVVDGKIYMKIGWNTYDDALGYGWYGDMAHVLYSYITSGPNELQKSIIYDDWGRQKTFEFVLPNGTYNVMVSVGWKDRNYAHQKIKIEGVDFVNDEGTTTANPYLVRTKQVTVSDNKLTMEMGIFNEYTMLNYMKIEASTSNSVFDKKTGENLIKIYPNPLTDISYIDITDKNFTNYEIIDVSGKSIIKKIINSEKITLYRNDFKSGIYFIKIYKNNSVCYTTKLNVE